MARAKYPTDLELLKQKCNEALDRNKLMQTLIIHNFASKTQSLESVFNMAMEIDSNHKRYFRKSRLAMLGYEKEKYDPDEDDELQMAYEQAIMIFGEDEANMALKIEIQNRKEAYEADREYYEDSESYYEENLASTAVDIVAVTMICNLCNEVMLLSDIQMIKLGDMSTMQMTQQIIDAVDLATVMLENLMSSSSK